MSLTVENVLSALTLLGLGGLFGTYLRILWERKNAALLKKQEFKEARYKCLLLLMHTALDFDKRGPFLRLQRSELTTLQNLSDEIEVEWHNMFLFASEDVLRKVHAFITEPSTQRFRNATVAMRADLWGGRIGEGIQNLEVGQEK